MDLTLVTALHVLGLLGSALGPDAPPIGEAYWVRELTPGWPPAFHPLPPQGDGMIEVPVVDLEIAGALILLAILCLVGVLVSGICKRKQRPRRR